MGLPSVTKKDEDGQEYDYFIRRITPKESFRAMGFSDQDFEKAQSVCSDTRLYMQAGNSICVPVLENIIKMLL